MTDAIHITKPLTEAEAARIKAEWKGCETVQQAIAAIMDELPAIAKGDRAPAVEGGYAYRGIEAIARELQPLMAKHGVVITPSASMVSQHPAVAMKEGWTDLILDVDWRIYGPGGDFIEARTQGIGRDKSDKGAAKALTQARKNLLLTIFCIADKADDADGQTYEHDRVEAEPAATEGHRAELRDAIAELDPTDQELVKLEMRNRRVPALTKPGATLTQLNELRDFIAGLRERVEPFDLDGAEPLPPRDDPHDKPFTPDIPVSATERRAVRSTLKREP